MPKIDGTPLGKSWGWSLEQTDQAAAWTHPQAPSTSKGLANHEQMVHLDLPPGWLAKSVTEPGSSFLTHTSKNAETEVCSKKRAYLKVTEGGEEGTNLKPASPAARAVGIYGITNREAERLSVGSMGRGDWEKVR